MRVFTAIAAAAWVGCGGTPPAKLDDDTGYVFVSKSLYELVASEQAKPADLALSGSSVVWTNGGDGTVVKVNFDAADRAPLVLAAGQFEPRSLVVTSDTVAWANFKGATVMRLPLIGGTPTVVAQSQTQPGAIATEGGFLYWTEFAFGGDISRSPVSGGAVTDVHIDRSAPEALSVCNGLLFWAESDGSIYRGNVDSAARIRIASGQTDATATACDGTHVYWTNEPIFADGTIGRVSIDGGNPQLLATGQKSPSSIAVDETHVYWTAKFDGVVRRVAKAGGEIETVVDNQARPAAVAVSSSHVYWAAEGMGVADGLVGRKPKP